MSGRRIHPREWILGFIIRQVLMPVQLIAHSHHSIVHLDPIRGFMMSTICFFL
jgi:hypothetical protein